MRLGAGVADCRELGKETGRVVTSGHDVPHAWQPRGRRLGAGRSVSWKGLEVMGEAMAAGPSRGRLEVGRAATGCAWGLSRSSWLVCGGLVRRSSRACMQSRTWGSGLRRERGLAGVHGVGLCHGARRVDVAC